MSCINDLVAVIDWCSFRKLTVRFGKRPNGLYEHSELAITINCHLAPEIQLHVLLHECGHHLIDSQKPKDRFVQGYDAANDPEVKRTMTHRVDVVDEELEAWHRGAKLAKRLGIKLDRERYNQTRSEYVKTYMKWALKVDGYNGDLGEDDDGEAARKS